MMILMYYLEEDEFYPYGIFTNLDYAVQCAKELMEGDVSDEEYQTFLSELEKSENVRDVLYDYCFYTVDIPINPLNG